MSDFGFWILDFGLRRERSRTIGDRGLRMADAVGVSSIPRCSGASIWMDGLTDGSDESTFQDVCFTLLHSTGGQCDRLPLTHASCSLVIGIAQMQFREWR